MTPNDERGILWMLDQDPDVLVGVLGITSEDLIDKFPRHVASYLEELLDEPDEGETVDA